MIIYSKSIKIIQDIFMITFFFLICKYSGERAGGVQTLAPRQGTTKSVGTNGVSLESHNQPFFFIFLFFFFFWRNTISIFFFFYFSNTILHTKKYKGQCPYASRTTLLFTRYRSQLILVKLITIHLISYHKIFLILRAKLYCYSIMRVIHQLLIISSINY